LKVLVLDNNSPFTSDILNCLDKLDQKYECRKCLEAPNPLYYDRIILSGRKKNDKRINAINSTTIRLCHTNDKPLLGICYGAEIIALTFGGAIRRGEQVVGMTEINIHRENGLMTKMGIWEAMEFLNSLVDDSDPDTDLSQLEHLLQTAEQIRHDGHPRWFILTGLIHDLGKILCLFGEPQWGRI